MVTAYHGPGNLSKIIDRLHVKFVGGQLCLDFVNTVGGRDAADVVIRDKIGGYEDLLAWSVLAGILDRRRAPALLRCASQDPVTAGNVLARAVQLRESLYRIFNGEMGGCRILEMDAGILRRELSAARSAQTFAMQAGHFAWKFPERIGALDRILWPVPLSAADLLTSDDLSHLGKCGGADCRWLFLDSSRNRHRRWCDMQDCGNRAKVRRFRQRQRQTD